MNTDSAVIARPFLGRSPDAPFEVIETRRAALQTAFEAELARRGIAGLVIQSAPYASSCWVKVECWMPAEGSKETARRASVTITLLPREFRRFPFEMTVEAQRDGDTRRISHIIELRPADIEQLVSFLTGPTPRLRKGQFRRCRPEKASVLEWLTLPGNRVTGLKDRWIARWRVLWLGGLLAATAAVVLGVANQNGPLLIVGVVIALISIAVRVRHPIVYHRRGQRPPQEPRQLFRFDSWQTVVTGLGNAAQSLREAVLTGLRDGRHTDVAVESERVWHWGLDDKVEREQIVVRFRRALVFVQIHAYGDDLYVDWEGFLNFGVWKEKVLGVGFDTAEGHLVVVHGVEQGWQPFGEYDLSDMNFALEWVHAVIRRELKRLMAERKIDEEIDFRIIREERSQLKDAKPEGAAAGGKRRLRFVQ
jgi:hypothetical protein